MLMQKKKTGTWTGTVRTAKTSIKKVRKQVAIINNMVQLLVTSHRKQVALRKPAVLRLKNSRVLQLVAKPLKKRIALRKQAVTRPIAKKALLLNPSVKASTRANITRNTRESIIRNIPENIIRNTRENTIIIIPESITRVRIALIAFKNYLVKDNFHFLFQKEKPQRRQKRPQRQ